MDDRSIGGIRFGIFGGNEGAISEIELPPTIDRDLNAYLLPVSLWRNQGPLSVALSS